MATHPFTGARKMKPTMKHRPAIWECMLATVFAMNDAGEVKYFDYDWDAARAFAGVDDADRDPRVYKQSHSVSVGKGRFPETISKGRRVLYVKRAQA